MAATGLQMDDRSSGPLILRTAASTQMKTPTPSCCMQTDRSVCAFREAAWMDEWTDAMDQTSGRTRAAREWEMPEGAEGGRGVTTTAVPVMQSRTWCCGRVWGRRREPARMCGRKPSQVMSRSYPSQSPGPTSSARKRFAGSGKPSHSKNLEASHRQLLSKSALHSGDSLVTASFENTATPSLYTHQSPPSPPPPCSALLEQA